MTCLSQSEQCRGELFRPNERSFATFDHSDLQVLQAIVRATLSHKCAIRYLYDYNKIKQIFVFNATKSVKWIFHQLHR